jgi:hypothetical protein
VVSDANARRVYVYEVWPTQADGTGTSGWSVLVVTDRHDLSDIPRITRVAIADRMGEAGAATWDGIAKLELKTVAVLDPRIAA